MEYIFSHATVGGTFDHLHQGHKHILSTAFSSSQKVTIALTTDEFVVDKDYAKSIQTFGERKKELEAYLKENEFHERAIIIPLSDAYGIALEDSSLDAIFVTNNTIKNAQKINKYRIEHNLKPLHIEKVFLLKGSDGAIIQSTRIRKGEIDRIGTQFLSYFEDHEELILPESLRENLRKPMGEVIPPDISEQSTALEVATRLATHKPIKTISVGDIITNTLKEVGFFADINIIDLKSRRKKLPGTSGTRKLFNRPSTINVSTVKQLYTTIHSNGHKTIIIDGEEDLLALPAILLAPLNAVVLYGQYNVGVVMVTVTEKVKEYIVKLLSQFNVVPSKHM